MLPVKELYPEFWERMGASHFTFHFSFPSVMAPLLRSIGQVWNPVASHKPVLMLRFVTSKYLTWNL